jgi:hypothetical protein
MRRRTKYWPVLAAVLSFPHAASASWFEFCELRGTVESITSRPENKGAAVLLLNVKSVEAKKLGNMEGYTDCREYLGQQMPVFLQSLRYRKRTIQVGDTLSVFRSAIDDSTGRSHVKVEPREHIPSATRVE